MGDVLRIETWLVKGRRYNLVWRIGAPRDTTAADRTPGGPHAPATGRIDLTMDLKADQQVALSIAWTDEVGNPTTAPADALVTYTADDPDGVLNFTDNGDGAANAAATGTLGSATVHAEASAAGRTVSGDLLIVVVPGDAERIEIVAGEPTEVTPDA